MFSKKATKFDEIFTVKYVVSVQLTAKITSIFVAFLEKTNFPKSGLNNVVNIYFKLHMPNKKYCTMYLIEIANCRTPIQ